MIAKTAHFSHRRALVIFCLFAVLGFGFFNSSVTSVSAQGGGVRINPGDNIQSVINRYPAGTLFTIAAGVHRMQTIAPRNGDVFVGENGAVLNGSRLLTNFQQRNGYWVATGQTQQGSRVGECASGYPRCTYPEDLFINNEPLQHVGSLSEVSSGRWYFDYNTDEVFFADDPTGKTVEISVTPLAFTGSGRGVTVRNLTIEKYATPAQSAALTTGGEWVVDNVTAQLNHGTGIKLRGTNVVLMNSRIFRNGQAGIHTFQADGSVINGNEIAYNHYAHFSPTWAASGGSKFARTNGLTVRNNYVHHNDGPGLWTDIDNNNIVYENNLVVYNTEEGIYHEISYNAVIRNNVVMFNGRVSSTYLMYGSQIFISASGAVEVYNNRVVVGERGNGIGIQQQQRGDGILGDWLARGNFVHSNVIVHTARAGQAGVMLEPEWPNSRSTFWSTFNNRFDRNAYYVSSANAAYTYWRWNDQRLSWSGIRAAGQEINGQLITDGFGSLTSIPAWNRSAPLPIGYPGANPQPQPTVTTAAPTNTPRPTIVATTPAPTALPTEPATPAPVTGPALTSFTLVSADTQQDIRTLVHGETINLATLPTQRINIRANTSPGTVGSVYMTLNSEARTENVAPYVLWGDDDGAYLPGQLRVGTYTLTGKAYSLSQRQGIEGQLLTVAFRVINSTTSATATPRPTIAPTNTPRPTTVATNVAPTNTPRPTIAPTNTPRPTTAPTSVPATPAPSTGGPTVTRLMLVDAITSRDLQVINNGDVINLAALPNRYVSIRIDTVGTVESIRIRFGSRERVENGSPFHLWGDDNGDPVDWGAQPGAYTMDAIPYSDNYGRGTAGSRYVVSFTFVRQTVSATATPRPTIASTNTPRPTTVPPTATTRATVVPTNTPRPTTVVPTNTPRPTTAPTSVPATPAPSTGGPTVTRLMLVDAITSRDLQVINNGDVINLAALPNRYVSIRIDTVGTVESIRIRFGSRERVENGSPFHLWGDDNGDPVDWGAQPGAYTMDTIPYSDNYGRGTAGSRYVVSFTFVRQTAAATVTPRPTIAPTNTRIPPTFAPPTSTPRPIVVPPTATPVPPTATTRPTNTPVPPTATTRPTNTPVPPTATPIPPTNTPVPPTATAVPPTNTPVPPTATTVPPTNTPAPTALPVTGHSIIHFILVDGDTDQDIRVMTNGETVNLATLPTRNINIRVVTNPTTVGSIKFILNGAQFSNANRVENTAPYALWGDENGDYYGWQPRLGSYTLLAQSFELRDLAGSAGRPMTVQFNVVDARPVEFALDVNVVGSGTVQMNPARTTFEAGTTVQMVAVPEAGWQFAGWSGAISSADVAATVTVTNNLDVVANFVQAQTPPTSFPPTVAAPTTTPVTPTVVAPTVVAPTVVAPTATPIPATLPLALSMDDGQSTNWTLNGSWSMTTISAYGGTGSAWMATPATQYGMLAYALPIDLRTAIRPELTFQSRLSATQHSPALEISTNTRDWTLVVSPQPSADWTEYTLDLTVYTGQMIWLRWTWTPLSATALQSTDTWMIDQVTVAEFVPDPIVPSATPLPTIAPSTTPLPTIALSATPLPTIEVPPTATPLPATPVPTTPPTAIPVVLQPLTLTSVCAGTWQIDNLNAVPLNVQWEVAGTGLRTPLTANPGATPLVTGAPAGQPESITLIFDLGDGLGERSVTQASNMAACP